MSHIEICGAETIESIISKKYTDEEASRVASRTCEVLGIHIMVIVIWIMI